MTGNPGSAGSMNSPSMPNNDTSADVDEDFGDFESSGESLLTLVLPELASLSQNWLAALKDHALLSLPPGTYVGLRSIFYYFKKISILFYFPYYYYYELELTRVSLLGKVKIWPIYESQ